MTLVQSRALRLAHFCLLYTAQGLPFGFVTYTLAAYLAKLGLGIGEIGSILALSTLPWSFKFIWGPITDALPVPSMGRRRPWLLFAQFGMAATIAAMIALPDLRASAGALGAMVFLHNLFSSLQDVSTDALAVELLPESERGVANGLMFGSSYFGTFLGGAGLGTVVSRYGLRTGLLVQVAFLGAVWAVVFFVRERAGDRLLPWSRSGGRDGEPPAPRSSFRSSLRAMARAFSLRSTQLGALLAVTSKLGLGVLTTVVTVFLIQQLGWKEDAYAQVTGGIGVIAGVIGSVLGGFLADRCGHRRVATAANLSLAALWLGVAFARPWWPNTGFITAYLVLESFLGAVLSVSLFALFMTISWPRVAATQFTAYMALQNLSTTVGAKFAATLHSLGGIHGVYLTVAVVQILVTVIILVIDLHETRRVLGDDSTSPEAG